MQLFNNIIYGGNESWVSSAIKKIASELEMTLMIAATRSLSQALFSSAGSQVVAIIYKGMGASRSPYKDSDSGSSISSSMVAERISRSRCDNLHPTLYPIMQLPISF